MTDIKKRFGAVVVTGVLQMSAFSAAAYAEDKDLIDYRQHIMKTLEEETAIVGMIVSSAAPPEGLANHAEAIALMASIALKSFEPKIQGGEAKPDVWAKWNDFSARMKNFADKSKAFSEAAKNGASVSEITGILVEALPCKDCHDVYRDDSKK